MLPTPQEPQVREPLCQHESQIASAAYKFINEIHKNHKDFERHLIQQGIYFLPENVQWSENTGIRRKEQRYKPYN